MGHTSSLCSFPCFLWILGEPAHVCQPFRVGEETRIHTIDRGVNSHKEPVKCPCFLVPALLRGGGVGQNLWQ